MSTSYESATVPYDRPAALPLRSRLSWPAIFAGVTLAIAIQLVLALLGTGIGFSLVDPVKGTTPGANSFGIGAGLYWVVSMMISLGAGSYAAARVAGAHDRFDGLVHGLTIWGLTSILTVYLITSAVGGIIGGAFRTVGGVASTAGQSVGAAAPVIARAASVDDIDIGNEAAAYLTSVPADPAAMSPQEAQKEVARQLPDLAAGGTKGAQAESRIVAIVAAQQKISAAEARQKVEAAKARFVAAKNDAVETAKTTVDTAAGGAAGTSFLVVLALIIGAASAGFGGIVGGRREQIVVRQ
ncbi:hypothetical protein FHS51_002891 [Sphingobium wenxiniae]|uniref:PhnA-like protein n=1 Tax=Sphingobium wenxiniae (strain DSM 21828 / CGMCC 1.7748 / JZ-1) TaxID=595605 RepID=A0A562K7V0_SPHWJ|nr:hypothetical protein [Sphingobium wenxiniae]MBB6192638.1 hypothetical protein [Sphingobium wenxiniae]TWH91521.1 hypothetical protein IQ35_03207 [Sphingobium wenxiniae]